MKWDLRERRHFVRVKFPCEIIITGPKKSIISGYVEDISAVGIKVIADKKLKVLSTVNLDIYALTKRPICCKAKVELYIGLA